MRVTGAGAHPSSYGKKIGLIYFLEAVGASRVKIGWTQDLKQLWKRLSPLRVGCPFPIRVLATAPGSVDDEQALQISLLDLHILGEWFHLDAHVRSLISQAKQMYGEPPAPPTRSGGKQGHPGGRGAR